MEASGFFVVAGLVICTLLAALPVILVARVLDQTERDRKRRTYLLRFPTDLDSDQVLAFIHAVTGTLRPLPFRLLGTPNLVLELLATEEGIVHRLRVPWTHSEFILQQLRQAMPGIRIEEAKDVALPDWDKVIELGQTNRSRTLRIHNPDSIASSILATTQGMGYGEVVMLQWVISPAIPTRPPQLAEEKRTKPRPFVNKDRITDQRTKLSEPNIAAVARIASSAMTDARATHLMFQMRAALASTRTAHTRFKRQLILPPERLRSRVTTARGPVVFPITLAASELVPLLAWPIGEPHVAGLPQTRARQLPPSSTIPTDGLLKVAVSNWTGLERQLSITETAATMHVYLCGRTGVGKTTLLSNMALEAIDQGAGLIALESKGDNTDFFHTVLRGIPASRIDDVIVMDVADYENPVGFNVLAQGRHDVIASDLQGIFESMYGRGLRADKSLYHGLMTLMNSKAAKQPMTFVDLVPLFSPMGADEHAFADAMVRGLTDDYLRNFWQDVENKSRLARDNYFQSIQSRIWQLNNRADVRRIIGQSTSSFDIHQVIRDKKILLVNLASPLASTT
jgi:hypothetical protein